ncbi:hypothetical protein IU427_23640 [Nocardia beijingensis]|uniref:hypothetical protein n=1 Tax=Nocardia beijingensis TaxID=95162 RepID=UPI0018962422|nr:hypothetical protein [Nocardia beijingensis]MBF6468155.1 hypothetical protein [Nocardia beijingensis]
MSVCGRACLVEGCDCRVPSAVQVRSRLGRRSHYLREREITATIPVRPIKPDTAATAAARGERPPAFELVPLVECWHEQYVAEREASGERGPERG